MYDLIYKQWLDMKDDLSLNVKRDYVSRCKRVERDLKIDLDDEYVKDHGLNLLYLLTYTKDDMRVNAKPRCNIKFKDGANLFDGCMSLKSAVTNYFLFIREKE